MWADVIANPEVAQLAHQPRLVAVGGGMPIVSEGRVVGGIGISGGNAAQDQQAAEIALKATGLRGRGVRRVAAVLAPGPLAGVGRGPRVTRAPYARAAAR